MHAGGRIALGGVRSQAERAPNAVLRNHQCGHVGLDHRSSFNLSRCQFPLEISETFPLVGIFTSRVGWHRHDTRSFKFDPSPHLVPSDHPQSPMMSSQQVRLPLCSPIRFSPSSQMHHHQPQQQQYPVLPPGEEQITPRRTPMACQFCRGPPRPLCCLPECGCVDRGPDLGRKIKCDGRSTCANCNRRNIVCVYVPV